MTIPFPPRLSESTLGALLLGACGCAIALAPTGSSKLALAAMLLLPPLAWWTFASPNRWLLAFIIAAWLLPPLPFDLGSAGPHVALLFVGIGAFAGVLTCFQWRVQIDWLSGSLLMLCLALFVSTGPAFLYSGVDIGAGTLTRVLLFAVSVYAFLYVRYGPFQANATAVRTFVRVILWAGVFSAVLACLDFYFQFPAAPGHSVQFIWLDSGVYRRAQGVFYEASTLGNLCVFLLVMIVAALVEPRLRVLPKWASLVGAVPIVVALVMSYSRGSLVSLGIAMLCLLSLRCDWSRWKRTFGVASAAFMVSAAAAFLVSPVLARTALMRVAATFQFFWTAPDAVLSGRLSSWGALLSYIPEEPWRMIFGLGYKTLAVTGISGAPLIADNTYLSSLIETGVFGIASLVSLNAVLLYRSYKSARSADPQQSFLGVWLFSFWMGETVQMLSGDLLTYWRVLPVFLCVAALVDRGRS